MRRERSIDVSGDSTVLRRFLLDKNKNSGNVNENTSKETKLQYARTES